MHGSRISTRTGISDLLGFQSNLSQNRALVALGNGDGTFGAPTPIFDLSSHGNAQFYDLVGDSSIDLTVGHYSNQIQLYEGDGLGGFTLASTLTSSATIRDYIVADLDGDKYDDMVVASTIGTSTQQLEIAWGLGSGKFSAFSKFDLSTLIGQTAKPPTDLLAGDLNQDQIQDLVIVDALGVNLLLGSADRALVFRKRIAPFDSVSGAALADLDGDGHLDLALSNYTSGLLTLYYGFGSGSFSDPFEYSSGSMGSAIRTGDIDADGDIDLVLSSGSMTVVRNLGARHWQAAPVIRRGTSPTLVRLADLNHDARLDLLSVEGTNLLVSLGDGTGKFSSATTYAVGEKLVDIEFLNANVDGHLDVAFTTNKNRSRDHVRGRQRRAHPQYYDRFRAEPSRR
ncbi:MAG: VCBS repeat-containing protein [Polyangiaceae bacterium]